MRSERRLILGFDTSAAQCAAALLDGERVLGRRTEPIARGQSERLLPLLEALLAEAGTEWGALDALAVCTGPGNFTGLRIAVAAARGLALALGRPAIGVSRFAALAHDVAGPALVLIAAPRDQAYAQLMRDGRPAGPPLLRPWDALEAPQGTICVGERAEAVARRLRLGRAIERSAPDPAVLARLAASQAVPAPRPAPLYLRPADAQPAPEAPPRLER